MKKLFILFCVLISVLSLSAQKLTGVWRGSFYSGYGFYRQQYKYEVQIDHLSNNSIKGVTYSYRTTVFYGKANMQGIYFKENKNVLIKELNLIELKIEDKSEPCAMTCNLEYSKSGNIEILSGTFTSVNTISKTDCGSGTVYLEKVLESDFKKEDFLIKKPITKPPVITQQKKVTPVVPPVQKKTVPPTNNPTQKKTITPPVSQNKVTPPPQQQQKTKPIPKTVDTISRSENKINPTSPLKKILPPPPAIFKSRTNTLAKTIITTNPDILVELYDNGEIDGDTVTVYHNNSIIANSKRLTNKPITIQISADVANTMHEFVIVANNLGTIPPNTALMVITTGGKRYEVFLTADNSKNAKVVIEYRKP